MKKNTFPMIEILVVMAIIIVLMGILIPAVSKGMKKAKIQKSKTAIKTLYMAIKQYESTYGFLPFTGANEDTNLTSSKYDKLLATLAGVNDGADGVDTNPRTIKFLELDTDNTYNDSWNQRFKVSLDLDYDEDVEGSEISGSGTLNTKVVIWSEGPDSEGPTQTTNDNVNSWD